MTVRRCCVRQPTGLALRAFVETASRDVVGRREARMVGHSARRLGLDWEDFLNGRLIT